MFSTHVVADLSMTTVDRESVQVPASAESHLRDEFWRELVARYHCRLKAYCRILCRSPQEDDDVVWDVWHDAIAYEAQLAASDGQWPILKALARSECSVRRRRWGRESPLDEGAAMLDPGDAVEDLESATKPPIVGRPSSPRSAGEAATGCRLSLSLELPLFHRRRRARVERGHGTGARCTWAQSLAPDSNSFSAAEGLSNSLQVNESRLDRASIWDSYCLGNSSQVSHSGGSQNEPLSQSRIVQFRGIAAARGSATGHRCPSAGARARVSCQDLYRGRQVRRLLYAPEWEHRLHSVRRFRSSDVTRCFNQH